MHNTHDAYNKFSGCSRAEVSENRSVLLIKRLRLIGASVKDPSCTYFSIISCIYGAFWGKICTFVRSLPHHINAFIIFESLFFLFNLFPLLFSSSLNHVTETYNFLQNQFDKSNSNIFFFLLKAWANSFKPYTKWQQIRQQSYLFIF